jgi:hypothetical protein
MDVLVTYSTSAATRILEGEDIVTIFMKTKHRGENVRHHTGNSKYIGLDRDDTGISGKCRSSSKPLRCRGQSAAVLYK